MKSLFNKKNKQKISQGTATVVSFICADAHLVLKSMADGVVRAEASIVNKLTGEAKSAIIEDRHNKTEETQEQFKGMAKGMRDSLKKFGQATHRTSMNLIHEVHTFNTVQDAELSSDQS